MWRSWVTEGMSEVNVFVVIEILPGSLPRMTSAFVSKESIAKDYPEHRLIIAFISALLFHHPAVYLRGFAPFTLVTVLHSACLPPSLIAFQLECSRLLSFWLSSSGSEHFFLCFFLSYYENRAIKWHWFADQFSLKLVSSPGGQEPRGGSIWWAAAATVNNPKLL